MNKRQKKKHLKKALILSFFSIELAEKYLRRYRITPFKCSLDFWLSVLSVVKRRKKYERTTTKAL